MHDHSRKRPSLRDFLSNLSGPMPPAKKLALLIKNNAAKIRNRRDCCGHPGEPGC
jgi:hypothetical protein